MKSALCGGLLMGAAVLMLASSALADECDETADCPQGLVCQTGECLTVPAECATFCENVAPCFSDGGTECTGVATFDDAGEMVEVVEDCHPYEGPTKDLLDDCLSDCAGSVRDDEAQAFMTALMACMKEADYDCGAMNTCGEQASKGGVTLGDEDVVSKSGGDGLGKEANAQGGSDTSSTTPPGGCSSCSASGTPPPHGIGTLLLIGAALLALLRTRGLRKVNWSNPEKL